MGVTWAAAWFAAGLVSRWIFGVNTDAPLPLVFGLFALIAGMVFSAVLALTEGRRKFDQMSLPRAVESTDYGLASASQLMAAKESRELVSAAIPLHHPDAPRARTSYTSANRRLSSISMSEGTTKRNHRQVRVALDAARRFTETCERVK
jgi:hypothetical protein